MLVSPDWMTLRAACYGPCSSLARRRGVVVAYRGEPSLADVFISYKKEDRAHAERIATAFAAEDISVWWDDQITPRDAWDAAIEREIAAAAAVVVLWTQRAVAS